MSSLKRLLTPVASLLLLAGCASPQVQPVATTPAATHTVVVVAPSPTPHAWNGLVMVPPDRMAVVAAPNPAPVQRVYVSVGQHVKRGDVLLTLANPQAQAAYQQARANLQAARAELDAAHKQSRLALDGLRQRVLADRDKLSQAQHAVHVAQQGVVTITATSPPNQADFLPAPTPSSTPMAYPSPLTSPTPDAPSPPVVVVSPSPLAASHHASVQVTQAPANPAALENAQQQLAMATRELNEANTQFIQAQSAVRTSLLPHEQRLQSALAAFKAAEAATRLSEMRSPLDGEVLLLNAWPGQAASTSPQQPLVEVVDLGAVKLQLSNVPVQPGLPGTVTFTEVPGVSRTAQVERVETGTGVVVVSFNNADGKVKPGMHGTFSL